MARTVDLKAKARRDSTEIKLGIGRRIAQLRSAAGLTQEQASARADIDARAWQRLESGEANPTLFTLLRVSLVVDATLAEVVTPLKARDENPRKRGRPRKSS